MNCCSWTVSSPQKWVLVKSVKLLARPHAICINIEPIRNINKVLFLKTSPNSELNFFHLELCMELMSSFQVLRLGIKFFVPMIDMSPKINIKNAPIRPTFNQEEESGLKFNKGRIIKEWESAIKDWKPSLRDIIFALSSYVSGISAANALCGMSKIVTENLVKIVKQSSQRKS